MNADTAGLDDEYYRQKREILEQGRRIDAFIEGVMEEHRVWKRRRLIRAAMLATLAVTAMLMMVRTSQGISRADHRRSEQARRSRQVAA